MNFNELNKMAWEEAFENRKAGWGEDIARRIRNEAHPFLVKEMIDVLSQYDLKGKTIAQFCCNNGRELLSLYKMGAEYGVGFDIAENQAAFANMTAQELEMNCTFIATDILKIDERFYNAFDYIFITIGALTWFNDLNAFFKKVYDCLKAGGHLFINEQHPVIDMLAAQGEHNYDPSTPERLVNSYFRNEPWVEGDGMGYMSDSSKEYKKTFYSFSHSVSEILNAIVQSGMQVKKMQEYDYDISGSFAHLNHKGIPLSYILVCKK